MDDFYSALGQGEVKPTGIMNYLQRLFIAERCQPGVRMLDVCCGQGLQLPVLSRYASHITGYVGLDIAADNLDEARRRLREFDTTHQTPTTFDVDFHLHDVAEPFPDLGLFDVAVYTSALEHLPREKALASLAHTREVMTSDGRLYLSTPNTIGSPPRQLQHRVHVYEWHADELTPALTEIGWNVVDVLGILPADEDTSMTAALTARYGPAAADWYARMREVVPPALLGPITATAVPEVAAELLYVCTPDGRR